MGNDNSENQWTIVFFSGTGGTRRAALEILRQMKENRMDVDCLGIAPGRKQRDIPAMPVPTGKNIIILFPVYAFEAPAVLKEWVEKTSFKDCNIVVVSVSGGGEMWPNTGCRSPLIKKIENKGGAVLHEAMLIMPCNFLVPGSDHMNMRLLNILPQKIEVLIRDIQKEHYHRSKSRLGLLQKMISAAEKKGARYAGSRLIADEGCSGCGLCAMNCPGENIKIENARAVFNRSCILCMRCIYNCPEKAIVSNSSFILKEGFDLNALEQRMKGIEIQPLEQCARGLLWIGVRKYLSSPGFD
ncbi:MULTISPECIES: EFR1 family ferrodoxin [unclassified Oceanispirochaeta]|uniref:EFR1 family ferrodoxin n=1 Tax=unclassified Oceanispirochaeta TaxID=2635722 RepID=UPI000E0962D9|nr:MULTISPECIES: EFR1 family ferrodoxin [unclassified Oceanispirochaeta]MBF9016302.1 EFR1 family ferrodoxin [Oceanispirochaeta sp. M2]NPD72765.1 hypothetical protein [Oceanispirochaeta sp. M1]RDG31611.1 hypothetical protein DV872_11700 [Oceanispirochaeta sp. M1]